MDISKKLKSVRESKGLTVEELAEKSGKSTETVMGWEDGTVVPTASDLILLSKTYEMTMDEMIYNDQNAPEYNREKAVYANEIVQKPMRKGKVRKALSFTKGEKITLPCFVRPCISCARTIYGALESGMGCVHTDSRLLCYDFYSSYYRR